VELEEELRSRIVELRLGADPAAWEAIGFTVEDGTVRLGTVPLRLGEASGWTLAGPRGDDFDGLATELAEEPGGAGEPPPEHPNSALSIDHLVVFTPQLERTIEAFERNGVRCRRRREAGPPDARLRQAFFRFAEVICELVEVPGEQAGPDGAARFWGLTMVVADLDGLAAELGPLCGSVRDAVQPGRRIATVRREAGLGLPVALITPQPSERSAGAAPRLPAVRRSR
jgi:hypothetical protein